MQVSRASTTAKLSELARAQYGHLQLNGQVPFLAVTAALTEHVAMEAVEMMDISTPCLDCVQIRLDGLE